MVLELSLPHIGIVCIYHMVILDIEEGGEGDEKEEKKRQKRGGKAAHKTLQAKKAPQRITLSKAPRGKRKMVTVITGLSTFGEFLS